MLLNSIVPNKVNETFHRTFQILLNNFYSDKNIHWIKYLSNNENIEMNSTKKNKKCIITDTRKNYHNHFSHIFHMITLLFSWKILT